MNGTSVRKDTIAQLRAQIDAITGAREGLDPSNSIPMRSELADILPAGGLARSAITHVSGPPLFVIELINDIIAQDGYVAVAGCTDLLCLDMDSDHVIVINNVNPTIIGMLVEGFDLVIYYPGPNRSQRHTPFNLPRPIQARIRKEHAACIVWTLRDVEGAAVHLTGRIACIDGVGYGEGRIRRFILDVTATTKTGTRHGNLTIPDARSSSLVP